MCQDMPAKVVSPTGALVHLFNDLANFSDDASGATAKSLGTKTYYAHYKT